MKRLATICLLLSSLLATTLRAQATFPATEGERCRYAATIQTDKACISGICVLLREDGIVKGCLFNEFGVTVLNFTYEPDRKKVKLLHVMEMMDKWYIRRVLRKDLAMLLNAPCTKNGNKTFVYVNRKRNIRYQLTLMDEEGTPADY